MLARSTADRSDDGRELRVLRWGLVPWWATDAGGAARRINARVETVASRPAYRAALAIRRCLLPADGYYEWAAGPDGRRQPYFPRPRPLVLDLPPVGAGRAAA